MTAAHLPGAILTPRYRGARAVASFNAADARSRATHLRAGWLPSVGVGHCNSQTGRHGPEMPARRSSDRPAALFNAVSNAERPSHGCPVGYRDNTGCCASARYTVASTPFARALLPKALAGTRWSAMTAPLSNASPTHEPTQAANYGDGWHLSHAPRLKPEARSPLPPCAKGRQDTQAGSAYSEDRA